MSPEEKAMEWLAELVAKLLADASAADEQVALATSEMAKGTPSLAGMALVSVCIDRAYTALESGFVRVARDIDGLVPTGESWHKALLHQMTLPIMDRRPAVLRPTTSRQLDILRCHRHWMRHAYAQSFDWARMAPAASAMGSAVAMAREDFVQLVTFLEAKP